MPKKRRSNNPRHKRLARQAAEHRRLARIAAESAAVQAITKAGWPEEVRHLPVDRRRQLPVPFIVEQPRNRPANFGILDYRRARYCHERRLCAMCGRRMAGDVALYGDVASLAPDGMFMEAPVHERCIEIAIGGLCPFLHDESWPRRRITEDNVTLAADAELMHTIGRTRAKRPAVVVIAADYIKATALTDTGPMPVYQAPKVRLVRFFTWQDGVATEAGLEGMNAVPMDPFVGELPWPRSGGRSGARVRKAGAPQEVLGGEPLSSRPLARQGLSGVLCRYYCAVVMISTPVEECTHSPSGG